MVEHKTRQVFKEGHHRKFLVVVDETPEFTTALYFAARVASRTGGRLSMLHVLESQKQLSGWVELKNHEGPELDAAINEMFRDLREKLDRWGFRDLRTESIRRQGEKADEIIKLIERDEDIAILVLGASASSEGPGPLVSSLTEGSRAGNFPIPIYLVPERLSFEEIAALA